MVSLVIGIAVLVISLVFRGSIMLMLRFDILNSILLSGLVLLLTKDMQWSKTSRWIIFIALLVFSFILQHTQKSMRILLGIMSTVLLMALGYGWNDYATKMDQINVVIICLFVGSILNYVCCRSHLGDRN